jgi:hypothetical protein
MAVVHDDDGKRLTLYLHRLLTDAPPHLKVDHVNGDTLDNRRHNLRLATNQQNMENRPKGANRNSKSGIRGVVYFRARGAQEYWAANVQSGGKQVMKYFPYTEEGKQQAALAAETLRAQALTHSALDPMRVTAGAALLAAKAKRGLDRADVRVEGDTAYLPVRANQAATEHTLEAMIDADQLDRVLAVPGDWFLDQAGAVVTKPVVDGKQQAIWLHQLVKATTGRYVRFLDGDKRNCRRANLADPGVVLPGMAKGQRTRTPTEHPGVFMFRSANGTTGYLGVCGHGAQRTKRTFPQTAAGLAAARVFTAGA